MSTDADVRAKEQTILVDVWFDVRCPWCFLGKHRLERAIELFAVDHPDTNVLVQHHSFELAPGIPDRFEGDEADYLQKYEGAPVEQSKRMLPDLQALGASEGVQLRFADLKQVNTRKAHRVFQLAQYRGLGEEMLERLFNAYFSECQNLSDPQLLADLAAEVGLGRDEALAAALDEDENGGGEGSRWDEAVSADHARAQMLGANGVPFSLFNAKYRVSGGQTAEVFAGALAEVFRREFE